MHRSSSPLAAPPLAAILLAAGSARRFGSDKLLASLADGTPVALAAARAIQAGMPSGALLVAVIRPEQTALATLLQEAGWQPVASAEAALGMGHSLAAGVEASREAAGWLVALADMPYLQPASVAAVAAALSADAPLAAPGYRGQRGHPVGFGAAYREELQALSGDAGARHLIQRDRARLRLLEVDDPGVLQDVDTPADLASSQDR
ncbi:MAG TPA: nucleotidyltransferase family protein [Azospira sp.]|nr:nucleotidyltransferase family protein [Azospira sp.]